MRDCLKGLLLSSIGNGRVKVIVGASGSGAESFLFEDFASSLKEKAPLAEFIDLRALPSKEIEDICVEKKKDGKDCFLLAGNLWNEPNFDVIINYCAGTTFLNLFFIAPIKWPSRYFEKITLIRGRVEHYFFPPTLYVDYLEAHPDFNVVNFLLGDGLDNSLVEANLKNLNRLDLMVLRAALSCGYKPVSERGLADRASKEFGKACSRFKIRSSISKLNELGILFSLNRYDVKKKEIKQGKIVFPIDSRFYKILGRKGKELNRLMIPALIAKLLYDGWDVKKAVYESWRAGKKYCSDDDAGFLIEKNGWSFLLFAGETMTPELDEKARLVPSLLPRIIVTCDALGNAQYDKDGLIHYSFEILLLKGLRIYEE